MTIETLIMDANLPEPTTIGETKTTYDLPVGTITKTTPPSNDASDYIIIFKNKSYVCNYFNDGETKITASYKINNKDAISIKYVKADGSTQIDFRNEHFESAKGDRIELICKQVIKSDKKAIIRFSKDVACAIVYNAENDEFSIEKI